MIIHLQLYSGWSGFRERKESFSGTNVLTRNRKQSRRGAQSPSLWICPGQTSLEPFCQQRRATINYRLLMLELLWCQSENDNSYFFCASLEVTFDSYIRKSSLGTLSAYSISSKPLGKNCIKYLTMETASLQKNLFLLWEYQFLILTNIRKIFRKNARIKITSHMGNVQERLLKLGKDKIIINNFGMDISRKN